MLCYNNKMSKPKTVTVNDKMQKKYTYELVEPMGKNFAKEFKPMLTPKEMLKLGVFGGVYMRDCTDEFPEDWFKSAKFATGKKDKKINYFGVDASLSLAEWKKNDWLYKDDPRGWFQWYCRYYMGRRIKDEDERQIKRWVNMRRHVMGVINNCRVGDLSCRKRQRQALLHWAYDSRKF
jgi:hypothetical protein